MTQTLSDAALLDAALAAIREVLCRVDDRAGAAPAGAPPDPERAAERLALQRYLASAGALLEASQTLMHLPDPLSLRDRMQRRMRLVEHARTAGRTAYGAALALTDPGAGPPQA